MLPLDTQHVLQAALADGTLAFEWLSAEAAASVPHASFSLSLGLNDVDGSNANAFFMKEKMLKLHCAQCGEPCSQKCMQCGKTAYCSKACQKADWKGHKLTCTAPR